MEGGILPLNDQTKELLKVKHPEGRKAEEDVKLQGPLRTVENIIFDVIYDKMVYETANITFSTYRIYHCFCLCF